MYQIFTNLFGEPIENAHNLNVMRLHIKMDQKIMERGPTKACLRKVIVAAHGQRQQTTDDNSDDLGLF